MASVFLPGADQARGSDRVFVVQLSSSYGLARLGVRTTFLQKLSLTYYTHNLWQRPCAVASY